MSIQRSIIRHPPHLGGPVRRALVVPHGWDRRRILEGDARDPRIPSDGGGGVRLLGGPDELEYGVACRWDSTFCDGRVTSLLGHGREID